MGTTIEPVSRAILMAPGGSVVSRPNMVTGTPWVAVQPGPQSLNAGQTLTLSATCASGYDFNGPVTYQWRRNGVSIADGPGGTGPGITPSSPARRWTPM